MLLSHQLVVTSRGEVDFYNFKGVFLLDNKTQISMLFTVLRQKVPMFFFLLIRFSNKSKSWLQQALRYTNTLSAHVGNSAWLHLRWWTNSCPVADERNRPDGATGLGCAVSRPAWGRAWIRKRRSGRYLTSDTLTPHSRNSAQKRIAELFELLRKSGTSNLTWLFYGTVSNVGPRGRQALLKV